MAAQRFVGNSVKEVLVRVRESLGPDAVIVEQHQDQGEVTVVACTELHEMQDSITLSELKSLPLSYKRQLLALGFGDKFVERVRPSKASLHSVVESVVEQVPRFSDVGAPLKGRWQFVGPPGAGRTSAIIKLAAAAMTKGLRSADVLLISTDVERMGGTQLLQNASQALGVACLKLPVNQVNQALNGRRERLVLIDREAQGEQLLGGVTTCLVLPATLSRDAMQYTVRHLSQGPHAVFVTQVDNCERWGAWLDFLTQMGLPLGWLGNGSKLPDDLMLAQTPILRDELINQIENFQTTTTFN